MLGLNLLTPTISPTTHDVHRSFFSLLRLLASDHVLFNHFRIVSDQLE